MRPDKADFEEWRGHPVTEWIFAQVEKFAGQQKERWSALAWEVGTLDPDAFLEARVRADSYLSLSQSSYQDWEAIDDSKSE